MLERPEGCRKVAGHNNPWKNKNRNKNKIKSISKESGY